MAFLAKLRIGDGTFEPGLRAELEAEGLVFIEEGLPGRVRYRHFRMPGRRHHGKVSRERLAIGITAERLAVYCRSGSAELIDSAFSNPRFALLEVALEDTETIAFRIDYDEAGAPEISGQVEIEAQTPSAAILAEHLRSRLD